MFGVFGNFKHRPPIIDLSYAEHQIPLGRLSGILVCLLPAGSSKIIPRDLVFVRFKFMVLFQKEHGDVDI